MEDRRQQRQQRPRVEVAAGLVAGQLPRPQHPLLARRGQPAADRPAHLRPVGDEVEREQQHREQLQQAAERGDRQLHGVVLLVADELLHRPVGVVEVLDRSRAASRFVPNVSLIVLDGVGDVRLGVRQQVGDLRADERADGDDEHEEHRQHAEQDQRRRRAPPPAPPGQPVDAGLDGERQEHRDGEQDEEAVELAPEEAHGEGAEEPAPEDERRRHDPARQPALLGRGDEELLGRPPSHRARATDRSTGGSTAGGSSSSSPGRGSGSADTGRA